MNKFVKKIFSAIFLMIVVILTLFLFEYIGKGINSRLKNKDVPYQLEKEINEVSRRYPAENFDLKKYGGFELGTLEGWGAFGEAFTYQPTFGDNPRYRGVITETNIAGDYWIGTYENRNNKDMEQGSISGDERIGTLTSGEFVIIRPRLSFLIGGGGGYNTRVELLIEDKVVAYRTGEDSETMRRIFIDVSAYRGKKARICIVDYSTGAWGHVNFDDLRLES